MIVGLMVKNEAGSIANTLTTLRRLLPDARILVFDTGSDDDTAELARTAGAEVRTDVPWVPSGRYDESYNAMLAACEAVATPTEWIFHAYGRRLYEGTWSAPADAELVSSTEFWSESCNATRVVAYRARLKCRYLGATHEQLQRPIEKTVADSGVRMRRADGDHPRPDRYERDLRLLENETDPRSRFYFAQTLACLERFQDAYAAYLARADMKAGDENEEAVALFRAVQLMPRNPVLLRVATRMCHAALAVDPDRGEPWLALADFCLHVGLPDLATRYALLAKAAEPNPRALFLNPAVEAQAEMLLGHISAHASATSIAPAA